MQAFDVAFSRGVIAGVRLPYVGTGLFVLSRFFRAGRCVGFQIAKHKLDSAKHHLGHLRSAKQQHRVTQSAVEDAPIAIAPDPDESIIIVGPDCQATAPGAPIWPGRCS